MWEPERSVRRMARHHIYLVPGFFGFANLGGITYFHHVREFLEDAFEAAGHAVEVVPVATLPTSSIRNRTMRLLETVQATAGDDQGPIHLIGHSTGGLDTRLFATPNVSLASDIEVEPLAQRVQSVVTVATPHYGTPVASVFNSVFGQNLLWAMSLGTIYTLRFGRLPLKALVELAGILTRVDKLLGTQETLLEQFYQELFRDFDPERRGAINEFLNCIRTDRRVIGQLTPGSIDLFNASTGDRDTARYGCVITRAAGPSMGAMVSARFDMYAHASHALFRILQFLSARRGQYFDLSREQELKLVRAYGDIPGPHSSDGVVPTLSQFWGEVIHIARADHLDVCGHFRDPGHQPPHVDWFISGSGFRRPQFDALWGDVARFLLA